jgi:hypothetical protein
VGVSVGAAAGGAPHAQAQYANCALLTRLMLTHSGLRIRDGDDDSRGGGGDEARRRLASRARLVLGAAHSCDNGVSRVPFGGVARLARPRRWLLSRLFFVGVRASCRHDDGVSCVPFCTRLGQSR